MADTGCSATNGPDANCGSKVGSGEEAPYDPDEHCSTTDNDQNCGKVEKDVDETCSLTNEDQNCNKPHSTPTLTDVDGSCQVGSTDESCKASSNSADQDESCATLSEDEHCRASAPYDKDQSCQNSGQDEDEACKYLGSNQIDADEHCGQPNSSGTGTDADQACGYVSGTVIQNTDTDEYCVAGATTVPEKDETG